MNLKDTLKRASVEDLDSLRALYSELRRQFETSPEPKDEDKSEQVRSLRELLERHADISQIPALLRISDEIADEFYAQGVRYPSRFRVRFLEVIELPRTMHSWECIAIPDASTYTYSPHSMHPSSPLPPWVGEAKGKMESIHRAMHLQQGVDLYERWARRGDRSDLFPLVRVLTPELR